MPEGFTPGEDELEFNWRTSEDRDPEAESFVRASKRAEGWGKIPVNYQRIIVSALTAAAVIAGAGVTYSRAQESIKAGQAKINAENHQRGQEELINHLTVEHVPEEVISWAVDLYNDPDYLQFVEQNKVESPEDFIEFMARKGVIKEDSYPVENQEIQEDLHEYQSSQQEL